MNEKDWQDLIAAFAIVHDAALDMESMKIEKRDWKVYHVPGTNSFGVVRIDIGVG